ncbi:protein-L-isoaspartate(D-aspartate) O-methyltransferase [Aquincola sp. MAHUQ-54]|uniref:Protein-L-isoaspartate O-methyltransferase n=1 Tax=Aquincola agrisoli TaxID=3119538 RepID=A0AAW9QN91_9BURK
MDDTTQRRADMVASQLAARGIQSPAVLHAMGTVPRERFVDEADAAVAYEDAPLPIAQGQTISQPYIVAAMIEAADVRAGDVVLEVGAGSGYATAVLSLIADRVCAVERHAALVDAARERLQALGCFNVDLRQGDGSLGWPVPRSFDVIIVSAAAPQVPPALKAQLAEGGRLVMPVGDEGEQRLVKVTRSSAQAFDEEVLTPVRFVPLVGAQGWPEDA